MFWYGLNELLVADIHNPRYPVYCVPGADRKWMPEMITPVNIPEIHQLCSLLTPIGASNELNVRYFKSASI